jgi:predicted N-acetyltransferase YhbS
VLDEWIARYAGQSERRDTTRTFMAVESDELVGYYSLRAYELRAARTAGKYPVPAVLLARLAVDVRWQGRGLGSLLLLDGIEKVLAVSESVGFEIVVVDAIDELAAEFYKRYGFKVFADEPLQLFMPMRSMRLTSGC